MRPPSASWSIQACGTSGEAAPQMMRSNGASSGQPSEPSIVPIVTLSRFSDASIIMARSASSFKRSAA